MSIKYAVLVFVFFIALCGFLFRSFYEEAKQESIKNLNSQQLLHARQAAGGIEDFFDNWTKTLTVLSRSSHIKDMDATGKEYFENLYKENKDLIRAVTRVDARGRIIYTFPYNRSAIGQDISPQKHVREIMNTHRPIISDVYSAVQGYRAVALQVPVFKGKTYQGSIGVNVNFQSLAKRYLEVIKVGKTGYAWVTSRDGTELFCPVRGHVGNSVFENCKDSPSILTMAGDMLAGHEGIATYSIDEVRGNTVDVVRKHAVYLPIAIANTFWSIVVASSEDEVLASLKGFRNRLIMITGILLLGGVLFSYYGLKASFIIGEEEKRRRAEDELRASEERYRTVVENTNDAIYIHDFEGNIIDVNENACRMVGYAKDELIGANLTKIVNPEDTQYVSMRMEQLMRDGSFLVEGSHLHKNGTPVPVEVSAKVVSREGMGRIQAFIRDITDRKLLESKLRQSQKLEAVGTLTGGIAHDFNNILTVITGFGTLLQMNMDKGNPLRIYVDQILSGSEKAAQLTRTLLAFSRQQPIALKPLDINEVIRGTEKLLNRLVIEDVAIHTILSPDEIIVMADATQIEQIFFNLATNARDAMPRGGVLTIATKAVELDEAFRRSHGHGEPGTYALLSISDTGTGMDEATKAKMFDPFFTTKEVGKGTGLGLSSVYGAVKQHHGYITVESEPDMGTTFHIYLPVVTKGAKEEESAAPVPAKRGNETILVAEDNEALRGLLRDVLTAYGYRVIEAADGVDAIDKFKEAGTADLLILDSVMPKKNGREAYNEIHEIKPGIKVLFTSGYTRDVVLHKGIEDETFDFMSKPISPGALLQKVREILDEGVSTE